MKKAIIPILLVLALFVAAGLYLTFNNQANAPTEMANNTDSANMEAGQQMSNETTSSAEQKNNPAPTPSATPTKSEATFSSGDENMETGVDVQVLEIVYNGTSFVPSTVNIKVGDYVVFRNNSDKNFWPASAMHPTHTEYPGFDAKQPIAPGGKYQFQFEKVGTWGFHDHLNPTAFGSIVVSAN